MNQSKTSSRGFARMDPHQQREIARKGGKAAHKKGTAHEFTSDEARAAGKKGGVNVSLNREHMAAIGRLGGKRGSGRRQRRGSPVPPMPSIEQATETSSTIGDAEALRPIGAEGLTDEQAQPGMETPPPLSEQRPPQVYHQDRS